VVRNLFDEQAQVLLASEDRKAAPKLRQVAGSALSAVLLAGPAVQQDDSTSPPMRMPTTGGPSMLGLK
jgi:hypothetical protein